MRKKNIDHLVKKAIQNDRTAFDQLCEAIAKDVLYMCTKIMGHRQDGEDAAQEAYIKIQKGIVKLKNPDVFHIWVNRVIVSACNDIHRKKTRIKSNEPIEKYMEILMEENREFLPPEYAEDAGKRNALLAAIDKLPEKHRKVLVLYYYEELSQKDIAQVLDISVDAVEHRLRTARGSVRKKLELQFKDLEPQASHAAVVPVATLALQYQADTLFTPDVTLAFLKSCTAATAKVGSTGVLYKALLVTSVSCATLIAATAIAATAANVGLPVSSFPKSSAASAPLSESFPQHSDGMAFAVSPASSTGEPAAAEDLENNLFNSEPIDTPNAPSHTAPASKPAPSSSAPPAVSAPASSSQAASGTVVIKGSIGFKDIAGNSKTEVKNSALPGCRITLAKGGRFFAFAVSGADGSYELSVKVDKAQDYTLAVQLPNGYQFTADSGSGTSSLSLSPNQGTLEIPTYYITDTNAPLVDFGFYNAEGVRTRSNPVSATVLISDVTDTQCEWTLQDAGGNVLASGKGKEIAIPTELMVQPGKNRIFRLSVTVIDASGNSTQKSETFFVVPPETA